MADPRTADHFERIDLSRSDDLRDVVHRVVIALSQGERVFVSTGGVVGVIASALYADAVRRSVPSSGPADSPVPPTILVRGVEELTDWVPGISATAMKLAGRVWPGPLTVISPDPRPTSLFYRLGPDVQAVVRGVEGVGFQCPDSPFVHDILRLLAAPAVLCPVAPPPRDDSAFKEWADAADCRFAVHSPGDTAVDEPARIVLEGEAVKVLRAGTLDESTLQRLTATVILFVCTGNTCRSPMAEALCKVLLAERIGCGVDELASRGFVVLSAGVTAKHGDTAAPHAIEVVRGLGGALDGHRSSRLTHELIREADHIVAMTSDHLDALLHHAPDAAPRARLLHPAGRDVADPFGSDRQTYARSADEIASYLRVLIDSLGV